MPLFATLVLNFAVGALAALAAARELRASPRALVYARAFRAVAAHEALVAVPIAAFLLVRYADWMVSYAVDGARIPSVLIAAIAIAHGALGVGGFATGARLLRDHRARAVPLVAVACGVAVLLALLVLRERVGVFGTYVQYRGGFGMRGLARSGVLGVLAGLLVAWTAAAGHLLWSLARRL